MTASGLRIALFTLFLAASLSAEQPSFLQALFDEREPSRFQELLLEANQNKTSKQAILEARFLYHVDHAEFDQVAKLSKELTAHDPHFRLSESEIFSTTEDWKSIIQYSLALKALAEKNTDLFEKKIKEAFWLSPKQASVFAYHIEEYRMAQHLNSFQFPYQHELTPLGTTSIIPVSKLLSSPQNLLLLYFWSPWNQTSIQEGPWLRELHQSLAKENVTLISIIIEEGAEATVAAQEHIKQLKLKTPCFQNSSDTPSLQELLRVDSLPTICLISPSGKILFNAPTSHPDFTKTLQKEVKNWDPSLLENFSSKINNDHR